MGRAPIVYITEYYILGENTEDSRLCKTILELPDNRTVHIPGKLPLVPGMLVLLTEKDTTELGFSHGTGEILRQLVHEQTSVDVQIHEKNFSISN